MKKFFTIKISSFKNTSKFGKRKKLQNERSRVNGNQETAQ